MPLTRSNLIILQIVGALALLPYPAILVANVMSIAAPRQSFLGALPFLVLSLYPVVFIALDVFAWRAMARGDAHLAFGLSGLPVLVCLAAVGLFAVELARPSAFLASGGKEDRKKIEPVNPLLWAIYSTRGDLHFPQFPSTPVDQALKAIAEKPAQVNIPVPPYGTPLKVALENLTLRYDGSLGDHQELIAIVRALIAQGAKLAENERVDLRLQWFLRRLSQQGPVTTESENPLVWTIVTREPDGLSLFKLKKVEIPLLNTPTVLHGTPLYAALLIQGPDVIRELIETGAKLSSTEENDPAAIAALAQARNH